MKVLVRKEPINPFPMKITCKQVKGKSGILYGEKHEFCGSLLEVDEKDILKKFWVKNSDCNGVDYGVFCPVCRKFVVIDAETIPESVKYSATVL